MTPLTRDQALDYFLEVRTNDLRADVIAALREAARRRHEGPRATAVVIQVAHEQLGLSYRDIQRNSQILVAGEEEPIEIHQATAQTLVKRHCSPTA